MNIEDINIEDTSDANYVIRKFFDNQFKGITMGQLEQLVLTVYKMGQNKGGTSDSESEPEDVNPFKPNDMAKAIEDIEIGHSGEFVKANTVVMVNYVKEDAVSFMYELDEDGEMIEVIVPFHKLEKVA